MSEGLLLGRGCAGFARILGRFRALISSDVVSYDALDQQCTAKYEELSRNREQHDDILLLFESHSKHKEEQVRMLIQNNLSPRMSA